MGASGKMLMFHRNHWWYSADGGHNFKIGNLPGGSGSFDYIRQPGSRTEPVGTVLAIMDAPSGSDLKTHAMGMGPERDHDDDDDDDDDDGKNYNPAEDDEGDEPDDPKVPPLIPLSQFALMHIVACLQSHHAALSQIVQQTFIQFIKTFIDSVLPVLSNSRTCPIVAHIVAHVQ